MQLCDYELEAVTSDLQNHQKKYFKAPTDLLSNLKEDCYNKLRFKAHYLYFDTKYHILVLEFYFDIRIVRPG